MAVAGLPEGSTTSAPSAGIARRSQRQRRSQAEEALLEAATRLFARRGIDRTALADISRDAGYSPRLITHHFGSKAALADRLLRRNLHEFLFVADASDGANELDALVAAVDAYFAWMSRDEERARAYFVLCSSGLTEDAELRPVFVGIDATFRTGIQSIVRAGQRSATIRSDVDPEGVATVLVGMLRGIGSQFLVNPDGVDLDAAHMACKQFTRHTLAPRPTSSPRIPPQ
jgi:AcrR family transcriptional regulator